MNIKNNMLKYKTIFISCFLWGIAAHGMTLFNKYSFHDDAPLFIIGSTYSSGRWMLGLLGECMTKLTRSSYYSTPLFKGMMTIGIIALICVLISELLEIDSQMFNTILSGIMVVFPVITGMFGYAFTAPYYLFGTLLGVMGVFFICKYSKWYLYLGGILLMTCSVGVYQANITVYISLMLIYMIYSVYKKKMFYWKSFFLFCLYHAVACIASLGGYLVINKYIL